MTKNEQHTAGPWEACERGDYSDDGIVILGDDMRVAVVNRDEDAALIAAAPDLLKALKALSASIFVPDSGQSPELSTAIKMTINAIAKAEGRS